MDAKEKGIMGALADLEVDFYSIPEFQRPFTWQEAQIEQLWDDLYENFTECSHAVTEASSPNGDSYFLGPLVFVRNKLRKSYDIIDGQQRITTLHILFWTMYHRMHDAEDRNRLASILLAFGKETKLKVSAGDTATMLAIRENANELSGNSKMVQCANLIKGRVKLLSDDTVSAFWNYIKDAVVFVVIVTDDYASAWELFIGLNGKGEPLNPSDLIKAHVCGNSEVGEDASKIWQEKILPLKSDSTFCLLMITRYRLDKFVTENALFRDFSKNFPAKIKTLDLSTFSDYFSRFWLDPIDTLCREESLKTTASRYLRMIRLLGRRDHTPILFKYAESFGTDAVFEEGFLRPIVVFQLRMAVARKRSRERKIMTELKKMAWKDKATAIASIVEFMKTEAPGDSDFELFTTKLSYGASPTRAMLLDFEEGDRGDKQIRDFQLEHLMPETPTPFWFAAARTDDKDFYATLVNSIGNLFPIDALTNPSVGNEDYDVKKAAYQQYLRDWSIARITSERSAWTADDIGKRTQEIAAWARKKWSFGVQ